MFENMIGKTGHLGGYVWLLSGCGGGPVGPGWGNYPFQMWMCYYDEEKCSRHGYSWLHGKEAVFTPNILGTRKDSKAKRS